MNRNTGEDDTVDERLTRRIEKLDADLRTLNEMVRKAEQALEHQTRIDLAVVAAFVVGALASWLIVSLLFS